jgi:hypothetical protein
MKREMLEFLLHTQGYDTIGLKQSMPRGQWVYGPKYVPIMERPYMQGYKTYPELTRRGPLPLYVAAGVTVGTGIYLTTLPFTVATAQYPEVAGRQYQSASTGQMSIGSSALNMQKPTSLKQVFTWSYWRGY